MHPESDEEVQDSLEGEKSEESDSEPPEDVSWNEARKSAIEDRERAESAIQMQEERKKFKAREKHERNLQQKIDSGRKYEKLPESILQSVAKVGTTLDAEADEKPRANTDRTQTLGRKKPGEDRIRKQNIDVRILEKERKYRHKALSESAAEFLRQHLYGGRVKRESGISAAESKRKFRCERPSVKFAKQKKVT